MKQVKISVTLILLGLFLCPAMANNGEGMVKAAIKLVESLNADQKAAATFEVNDTSREIWHFLPVADFGRYGLPLSELDDAQDQLVLDLVKASLSDEGFEKAHQIMGLELVLKAMENNSPRRDPQQYHISVYGTPSIKGVWSWGFSGHHLSLHFTMVDGQIAGTPTFLGANPGEVREGDKTGLRVLKNEEEKGLALINAMSDEQRETAIFSVEAPYEILTVAHSRVQPLDKSGIKFMDLSGIQKNMLKDIVEEYISVMPEEVAKKRRERIENDGWDEVYFAWAGVIDRSAGHYYRVQGPGFLVEFDNTQNNANHIHSVWRDFNGDFGRDLIGEHYKASHRKK
jgi:hypothetical protein